MSDHGIDCSDTRYLILYFEILKEKKTYEQFCKVYISAKF